MESSLDKDVSRDLAFVFNNVANYQTLVGAFLPGVEVHVLDAQRDGLEQMAAILAGRSGIAGVHVIGHGAAGTLELGTLTLDAANVGAYADVLGRIGSSLAPGGDILLYGCDVAAGVAGAQFVGQIAQETGADVAASVDATGGAQRGGNWTLEYQQGDIGPHAVLDASAVRSLDTLLAIPAAGLKDVTSSMDTTPGNFVAGFTLGSTVAVVPDTGTPSTGDGIYFDSTADQTTATKDATFTITADNVNLGSFDLTALDFDKYSGAYPAAFLLTVTGYKPDGTVKATININSSANSTGYDTAPNFSAFTGIVKYTVEIASKTLLNGGTETIYPVSNWTFDSFTIANPHGPNVVTTFLGGSTLNVVQSTSANDVVALLHVSDTDNYQTLAWTQLTAPAHGSLSISGGTASGGTTNITPGGTITYTPTSAYVGTDSFTIKVYDGFQAVTKTISVNVAPATPSAPSLAGGTDSGTSSSDKITKLTSLTFTGTGAAGDNLSTVKVWVDKNGNGVFDAGTDVAGTAIMTNGAYNATSLDVSALADGVYNVYAQSTYNGLTGAASAAGSFTLDRTKPTVTITSSSTTLTPTDTATITFTFSEDPGTSFTWDGSTGDLTVTGGTVGALSGSGTTRTAVFTPDGVSTSASVSVAANSYFDTAGNFGTAGSSPAITVVIDTTPPAAPTLLALQAASNTGVNPADNATKLSTPTVTGSAEAGSTVKLYEGATLLGSTTADASGNWTITTSTLADGSHTLTATAKDAAGNVSTASSGFTIKVDTVAPTLSISNDAGSPLKIGQTSTITFTFSEDPGTTFTAADISVSGGTLGALSGSGTTRTAVFTPSNGTNSGTASVTVAGSSYTDAAGNAGTGSASTSFSYDTKAPTLTITSDATGPLKIGQTATVTFSFSEDPGGTFLSSDIAVIGGTLGSFNGTGATRTAVFTPAANTDNGSGFITVGASTYNDAAGNTGAADSSLTISYDTKAPAAPSTPALAAGSDTGTSSTDHLTKLAAPSFTGTAEVGATVKLYDGATLIGSGTAGADSTWTITSTANLSNGAHSISAVAEDAAHNLSTASGTLAISVDTAAPALTITTDATSTLKTGETATITFTFSEDPGTTFSWDGSSGSVVVSGGTLSAISGSGNTRTAIFTPAANTDGGTATISVAGSAYTDAAGNAGAADASASIGYDTKALTVAITVSNPAMAIGDTSNIVFTFSENPGSSFDASDLVVTGGTLGTLTGTGLVRSATFVPDAATNAGTASVSVIDHSYSDAAGNTGSGAVSPGMVYDTLAPTVSITSDKSALKAGETATVTFTFSEDPGSSFTSASVAVSGGTLGAISGTGTSRTAVFTPTANTNLGTVGITIAAGAYTDAAHNDGGAGTMPSISFDTLAPTLAITSDKSALKYGESATITFTFSEDPGSSFTSGGITVTAGTLGAISGTGTVRTAVFTPTANTNGGTASITVAHGAYTDAAGNDGGAGTTPSLSFDTLPPAAPSAPVVDSNSDTGISHSDNLTSVGTPKLTGTAEAGATVKLYDVDNGNALLGTTTADVDGNWSVTTTYMADGTHSIAAIATDAAGNTGAASATTDVRVDTVAPTLSISSDKSSLKAGETATITFTFSEDPGSTFSSASVGVSGGTLGAISGSGNTRTAVFTPTADTNAGAAGISVAHAAYTDAAGNDGGSATLPTIHYDTLAPTVTITSDKSVLKIGETATITFTFSEDPGTSFGWDGSIGTLSVSGGTLSATSGSGTTRTAVFTPTAGTNGGTASITVGEGVYVDAAGNPGHAGTTPSIQFDTLAPNAPSAPVLATASDSGTSSSDNLTKVTTPTLTGTAEAGATVKLYDGATLVGTGTADGSGNWSIATNTLAEGSHSIVATATDVAGNTGAASASLDIVVDMTPPTLAITSDKAALIAGQTATVTFTFSEDPGSTFTSGDIVVSGGTLSALSGSGTVRTAVFTPASDTNAGTASITVAGGVYTDAAGNAGGAGTTPSIQFDTLAPTVAITSDKAALKIGETATITFTFSEDPGASFTSADLAISGGTLGAISGTGTTRTAVFTPTASTNGGTASITIGEGSYLDAAGNAGHAGGTPSLVFDTLAPNAPTAPVLAPASDSGTSSSDNLTKVTTPTLTGTAEAGATVKLYDGATLVGTGTADGSGNWSIAANTLAEGSHSIMATATDAAGNTGAASAPLGIVVDTTAPTLAITSDKAALIAGQTAAITFTFSEDPGSTFTSGDIVVSGGTLSALSGSGNVRTAVFTPTANTNAGTASITVAGGAYTDAAGNAGGAGITPSVHFDTLVPTVAITSDKAALKIGETATITFTFSEDPGASFTSADLAISGGTLGAITGTGTVRTAVFTPAANTNGGTASITIGEGSYLDAAGNAGHAGSTPGVVFDTLAPNAPSAPSLAAASDSGTSSSDQLTNVATPTLTGTAEAGATVKLYDGATLVGTGTADGAGNWSITTSTLAEGSHAIVATATDAAGNTGAASAALAISIDQTAPTLAITSDKAALIAGQTATVTFTFSEDPGSTFTSGDIVVNGGTLSALSGTGAVRTAVFTPAADLNAGTASITVASSAYTDAAGNAGGAGTTPSIHFDTLVPTVAISSDKAALKIGETATITFSFSEDPGASFTSSDVTVSGGTLGAITGTGATRTAVFTPDANTNGGTASITIGEGSYLDAAGNAGHAGATPVLVFDTKAPTLTITSDKAALIAGQTATVSFTFSEDPGSSFASDDIVVSGGALSALAGTGTVRTAVFTPTAAVNGGTASITVAGGTYADAAGNDGAAGTTPAIQFDTLVPTVAITSDKAALKIGETATITFTFSEDPGASFTSGDLTISGGTLGAISGTGAVRTAVFTPAAGTNGGAASITIDAGKYTDAAGNPGQAGATPSVVFDTQAPAAPSAPVLAPASDSGASSSDNITNAQTLKFTGTAENGATVTLIDNNSKAVLATGTVTGDAWSIDVNGLPEGVTSVAAFATDAAGNTGATSAPLAVTVDRTAPGAPSLALASGAASGSTVNDGTVKVLNLAPGAAWQYSLDAGAHWSAGTGDNFKLTADNSYTAIVRQLDTAGNVSASSAQLKFNLDTTGPTSTVTISDNALVTGETATVTIRFSEPVAGFGLEDIAASNGTLSNLVSRDGGLTWTATLTPAGGTVASTNVVTVNNTGVFDGAGNAGVGTNSSPNYSVQTSAIGASIELSDTTLAAGETAVVTIHFSEAVPGLRLSSLGVPNGVLSGLSSADGGLTWTATLTPAANISDATNVITLDNASLTGASGQHGQGTSTSANYGVFTVRPTATVTLADHLLAAGGSTAITIKFSTAVSDFDGADISVTHATLSSLRSSDGGVTWTGMLTAGAAAAAAQPGSIKVDLRGVHDAAGNTGLGLTSATFVLLSANAKSTAMDGVTVTTDTFKDPNTGQPQQAIVIPEVQAGRVDDSSTSHPGLADIPLASAPGSSAPLLTASLPTGAGMLAFDSPAPLSATDAATDLIQRINSTTPSGSSTQSDMAEHGQDFLASLGSGTVVETATIVPTVAPGATLDQPIVISGAAPSPGSSNAPVVGLVIDATGLPAGSTLQLDNVDFAAVTGDVRLFGGAGRNYVVADGGSQTIYLGPDDDLLFGGGGDDFIGSAGGNDILHGGDGNDLVAGGIGNDNLFGDAGNDTLNGGRSTTGNWSFHISASGAISATHSGAVFTLNGSETVQGSELDATVPELRFLKADQQKVAGIALLYAALDRVPDLAGLSFWATSGASLQDVAKGVLASAEFGGGALGQAGNAAFISGMYQHVLGRAPEQAALDFWNARLSAGASRADVLIAVALSDEHKKGATTADGITIGQGSVQHEAGWFAGSGDDILDGGAGSDWLVGGDGFDTVVYAGNRAQYHFTIGADNAIHVLDTANGDLDTLLGIEAARFKDGTIDITVLQRDPAQLARVGLMYEAVLHRPADLASLASWTAQNMSASQLAQAFTASADYQSKFAGMSDAAFVQALYANSGLAASAAGGMQSWQDYLGHHSRAELIASWIGQDAVVQAQFGASGLWLA